MIELSIVWEGILPLSWNEIRQRAFAFSEAWKDASDEDADGKSFWDGLFDVFGVSRRRVASFEKHVRSEAGKHGYIDLLWPGVLLVEHKSRGKSLDRAHQQAKDYFPSMRDDDLPQCIIVCDFDRFRITDLDSGKEWEFKLRQLPEKVHLLGFMAGYKSRVYKDQDGVNVKAARKLGKLHDELKAVGYTGHKLEVYLVRLLFCLFAC